eukprot:CAMPEP_0197123786 /NCGR_PEP_ID=MMETSP1390-20130617/6918_1 /TAXON_ID=38833 /ORGANISM="Micromonas sp., Strain CCMP2099" /LENGTH=59 /DNA_ID=CAMNT_0042565855 /DNA_START=369 /DNA_END=548 /DNA_ORIENTATION=-
MFGPSTSDESSKRNSPNESTRVDFESTLVPPSNASSEHMCRPSHPAHPVMRPECSAPGT